MKNGIKVSLICRGEHLKAIQNKGLLMQSAETNTEYFCKPIATDDPNTLEKQDYIIVTLKAHSAALTASYLFFLRPLYVNEHNIHNHSLHLLQYKLILL